MHAGAILKLLRGHGCTVTTDGEHLSVRKGQGVLTDALRQAIASEKAAIMAILAAEQVHALMPSRLSKCGPRSSKDLSGSSPRGSPFMNSSATGRSSHTMKCECWSRRAVA
jgi:TubC N-terminal docking domain